MYDCNCLLHPFQNDPGTSQSERVVEDLLSDAAKIDARELADLLDYFVQMSRHINFYDTQLSVSDWQPFFQKSIPFTLASVIKTQSAQIEQNFDLYNSLFEKKPSAAGLQLHVYFIYYRFIKKINTWYLSVKDSDLPIESFLEILIKDKLQQPVKLFIGYTNAAVKWYRIKKIDFSKLDMEVWNLQATDLYALDKSFQSDNNGIITYSKFQRINNLFQKLTTISSPFFDSVKLICVEAENNLEPSLRPLKEELQKKHPPHLGLLFAFLNIFRQLQDDLNGYTRKHLDFFYKDVLQIKSRDAIADKTHIVFEIQKQLEKYLVKKGILVKDGKDNNKQEILFSLEDDIVINKTEVASTKTLFLNNKSAFEQTYVEGVYIANDATKADGIDKDFIDGQPNNFSTLGAKLSKYSDPETKIIKPYPNARLGFILASPVLYLKEGTRTVNISFACQLRDSICADMGNEIIAASKNCCDDDAAGRAATKTKNQYPDFLSADIIFTRIKNNISKKYIYLSEDFFKQAISKGLEEDFIQKVRLKYLRAPKVFDPCYCDIPVYTTETSVPAEDWNTFISPLITDPAIRKLIDEIFKPETILNVLFSGEKDWISPATCNITMGNLSGSDFMLTINATINPDQPAVTFYSKETLKEDFDTTQPLVKIELNDRLKFTWEISPPPPGCCLLKNDHNLSQIVSFYHFFRNVKIEKDSKIDVQVCGLKNFIVQNDESLQDVNGPVFPFGTRPEIKDFTIINPPISPLAKLIGPEFYIGSKEVFCKKWNFVRINLNWKDKPADFKKYYQAYLIDGLNPDKFKVMISVLQNGIWQDEGIKRKLFDVVPPPDFEPLKSLCDHKNIYEQGIILKPSTFPNQTSIPFTLDTIADFAEFKVDSRFGFIKLNLRDQDFLHKDYSFVLARQMIAFGKLPKEKVEGAIYYNAAGDPLVVDFDVIYQKILSAVNKANQANSEMVGTDVAGGTGLDGMIPGDVLGFSWNPSTAEGRTIRDRVRGDNTIASLFTIFPGLKNLVGDVKSLVQQVKDSTDPNAQFAAIIPNEPWTPIISNMSLDYTASATLEDIDLIHLYPYVGTYSHEEIKLQPTLFPTFCDEGTLFLGLKNLVPGNNMNLLFQLAEATSDSESEKQEVQWHYLDNNVWKPLRTGFEVLDDDTGNLTTSGIVKFALPANMTNDNTIMPKNLHWIKATIPQNSKAVSEITGIHPQAISVTFTNDAANDKLRLSQPLVAGSISKLNVADANVKSVQQYYNSFGGEIPEIEQQYYVRVSEQLRHKGRAIQKFDYERLALQEFQQLFKVKCINHSFALDAHLYKNDFPYAPGYIILAVIPDLNKLKAGNSFEPKVPVSIIEKIETYIRKRTSPFVRFRAMNPRYEKINFCLRVNLLPGKDENYYKEQLKEDVKELLAPWAVGKYDKLTFGQCVYRSDIIRFLEHTDYVDFITDFRMGKELNTPDDLSSKICPDTPRSILIAGDIEVCINKPGCDDWKFCCQDDNNQIKIDCCSTEKIPVADYCIDKTTPIG